ncbi:MAG TPA: L,D-transpeptidase [Candidatus Binatia bacterium]|jgi:hypothetical protein
MRRLALATASLNFLLFSGLISVPPAGAAHTKGREVAPLAPEFKPGDYVWKPEASPAGPVVVIVSIPEQTMFVYRNGVRIGRSTVSTGAKGHATPTGVFTILQKKVDHESSIYKGSKMPHMQRLTWGGIAMHAGQLPGYPASHGCVRLPVDFAAKLYKVTTMGTTVIVTDQRNAPGRTADPGLLLSGKTGEAPGAPLPVQGFEWQPEKSPNGAVSIIFSMADMVAYVYRNGVQIGRASFGLDEQRRVHGSHVYSALAAANVDGPREWLSTTSIGGGTAPDVKTLAAATTTISAEFVRNVRAIVEPGTSLILTDLPVSPQTHSEKGFEIMTTDPE